MNMDRSWLRLISEKAVKCFAIQTFPFGHGLLNPLDMQGLVAYCE